jgi:hypothetical protein
MFESPASGSTFLSFPPSFIPLPFPFHLDTNPPPPCFAIITSKFPVFFPSVLCSFTLPPPPLLVS